VCRGKTAGVPKAGSVVMQNPIIQSLPLNVATWALLAVGLAIRRGAASHIVCLLQIVFRRTGFMDTRRKAYWPNFQTSRSCSWHRHSGSEVDEADSD
jgi:hypothetical protein